MSELNEEARLRREVFALYGLSMYHAQCFEKSLVILVSIVFNKQYLASSVDKRDAIFEESFKKTAGALVRKLKESVKVSEKFETQLIEAVEKRNWLAHDYFWHRAGKLLSVTGNEAMINELTEIYQYFDGIDKSVVVIYERWMAKVGISKDMVDSMVKEMDDA